MFQSTGSASWASSTNINTPCSLSTANSNAVGDDIVLLLTGNYGSQYIAPTNSGTSGHPITFRAQRQYGAVFTRTGGASVNLSGISYIVIDGLSFTGGTNTQVTLAG